MHLQIDSYHHRQVDASQEPETATGDYFVSARDEVRFALVSGPYVNDHAAALGDLSECKRLVEEVDPKAVFYAFGTCRLSLESGVIGFLQRHKLHKILSHTDVKGES